MAVLGLAVPFQYLPAPVESASAAGLLGKPNVGGNIVDLRNRSIPLGLGLASVAAAQRGNTCPHLLKQCYRPFALERAC